MFKKPIPGQSFMEVWSGMAVMYRGKIDQILAPGKTLLRKRGTLFVRKAGLPDACACRGRR